jgi:hypothetical protein
MTRPANLRAEMPTTAALIDALRDAFGAEGINANIKKGMAGVPGYFHAAENGREVGTPAADTGTAISLADMVIEKPPKDEDANRNHRR